MDEKKTNPQRILYLLLKEKASNWYSIVRQIMTKILLNEQTIETLKQVINVHLFISKHFSKIHMPMIMTNFLTQYNQKKKHIITKSLNKLEDKIIVFVLFYSLSDYWRNQSNKQNQFLKQRNVKCLLQR